jgi:hypothetical protein
MEMRRPGRRSFVLALALPLVALASLEAQTLNPVVTVLPRAVTSVPNGCEEGPTPAPAPRVTPEEKKAAVAPAPEIPLPPPSTTLRGTLRALQEAAERNDKDAFTTALGRAASIIEDYPPGGEKTAATAALKVYNDVLAFWNYQFEVATGAFFDASSRDLLSRLKAYPDYQNFVADKILVDASGTRLYPTRETRDFLVREAAARLRRGGAASEAKVPASSRTTTPAPKPAQTTHAASPKKPVTKPATKPAPSPQVAHGTTKHTTTKHTTTKHTATTTKPEPSPAATAHKAPQTHAKKPAAKPVEKHAPVKIAESPKKVNVTERPAPVPAPPTPTPVPVPVTTTTAATQTTATASSDTATTASQAVPTATTTSATTESTTTQAPVNTPVPARGSRRNLILPIILILLGVGVLILLFRTSS